MNKKFIHGLAKNEHQWYVKEMYEGSYKICHVCYSETECIAYISIRNERDS